MPQVFVAAGSNIDAANKLAQALRELRATFGELRCSAAWCNKAVGFEGPDFINLVVAFASVLPIAEVLGELHRIEALCGRPRQAPKWEPRAMDLDLLLYGETVGDFAGVILPRPDLIRRPYMLGPMTEIAGELRHPTLGLTFRELWQQFDRAAHPMQPVALPMVDVASGEVASEPAARL